ncbi:uncharacterized protein LOC121727750 isoform X2 [Aricia agestis]|uniref:uncharacterized protein LOC121727750 isoform X2 n=1 Tax=Aricia agestis TaxID=91739 RepID=UPI001C20748B|nr:uncharacterized protein LOC121727750 isoform X2 [Aricia agestis]
MKSSSNQSSTNRKIIKNEPEKINKKYTTELKQTLIDNFIKSMESKEDNYTKFLLSVPKSTASRITINLNKNKQSFDVASNSSKKEVDLENIRNKFKDTRKPLADKKISINNDKVMSKKRSPKMNKFDKMNTKSSYPKPMQLKPRDSLVVKHSREIRRSEIRESVQKINSEQKSGNADARKHYRGDDCPIDDPNVRDKEIQRLLGLTKKQTTRLNKASKTCQHCGFKKCPKAITISVKKKRLPRSPFTQTNNIDQNNVLEILNVNLNEKLVKFNGLSRSPITIGKPDDCINRALKSNSHRIDKETL